MKHIVETSKTQVIMTFVAAGVKGVVQTAQYRTRESPATVLRKPDLRRPSRQVDWSLPLWRFVCGG